MRPSRATAAVMPSSTAPALAPTVPAITMVQPTSSRTKGMPCTIAARPPISIRRASTVNATIIRTLGALAIKRGCPAGDASSRTGGSGAAAPPARLRFRRTGRFCKTARA